MKETRIISMTDWEIREDGETPVMEGYAAVYNQQSEDLGGFRETIRPGFFQPVLEDDVRALFNHDSNYVLGRSTAGTLALVDEGKGLKVRISPPDTIWARDLMVSMKRGDVNQMSFGFSVEQDKWTKGEDNTVMRELVRASRLLDVSVVTFPAYPQTSVQARDMASELAGVGGQGIDTPDELPEKAEQQARLAIRRRKLEILKRS